MENVTFVFLYGAGLRSFIWEKVAPLIRENTLYPEYPGRDPHSTTSNKSLNEYADFVLDQISRSVKGKVVLVAHSIGGVLAMAVGEKLGERLAGIIGVGAIIPSPGKSFLSCLPLFQRILVYSLMKITGTKPPDAMMRSTLCKGLDERDCDRVIGRFVPESLKLYTGGIPLKLPDVPVWYIRFEEDENLTDNQIQTITRNIAPQRVLTLPGGHLSMMSHPDELADVINEFSQHIHT